MKKTELEIKRELSEKIAPEIANMIKKYGYEAVAFTWHKTVEMQRKIARAEAEAASAQREVDKLKRQLIEA